MFTPKLPRRRAFGASILLAAALLGATALSTAASAATLTIAATAGPTGLDPTTSSNGVPSVWFPNLSYAALIWRAPDGTAKPGLAMDWKYSDDRLCR